jgi:hypothetical protein
LLSELTQKRQSLQLQGNSTSDQKLEQQRPTAQTKPAAADFPMPVSTHAMTTMASVAATGRLPKHTVLNSSFPVLLPELNSLFMSEPDFQALVRREIAGTARSSGSELRDEAKTSDNTAAIASHKREPVSNNISKRPASKDADNGPLQKTPTDEAWANKVVNDKGDITNVLSHSPLVDLFHDLGENTGSDETKTLLNDAWKEDDSLTLKIVFNARSIHLGKSNRVASYKAFGWLAENHPLTLLANLQWLVRPVIAKNAAKSDDKAKNKPGEDKSKTIEDIVTETKHDNDNDFEMVDIDEAAPSKSYDVRFGVSHGYWKDLLNLVVFAANDQLKFDGEPTSLLNQDVDNSKAGKRKREWDPAVAKVARHQKKLAQNDRVQGKLKTDPFYRALHVTVARLFAAQLKEDMALLDSGEASSLRKLSLAAKWAPTFGEFHDKHTFILSTIAEILFPDPILVCPDFANREAYLRHARERYRQQYASPLRKALSVVERDVAAQTFANIDYDRVPSLAMDRYTGLFMKKDFERFNGYVQNVAQGKVKISGATLLPSALVSKARSVGRSSSDPASEGKNLKAIKAAAQKEIQRSVIDGQWKTLVKRVRDAGLLESSIAICDVSGSMSEHRFEDGSSPIDSAIGLSLLISEVTTPPYGGNIISFHETPTFLKVGGSEDTRGLVEQVHFVLGTPYGLSTDFVAVFDLLLSIATSRELTQDAMVKNVFVFSDMQFNSAQGAAANVPRSWSELRDRTARAAVEPWTSSFERIQFKYAEAGYEVPRLIVWNLSASSTNKPVTMYDANVALVSGYSQGMLRAFLEGGAFEHEEELVEEPVGGWGEGRNGMTEIKMPADPLSFVKKAVELKAYSMLEVVD